MKHSLPWAILVVFFVIWLSFPTSAAAAGPTGWKWEWLTYRQVVKVIDGMAYQEGKNPMHYSAVAQQLRRQGYAESGWSSVGGTGVIYHYFTKTLALRAPMFPFIFMAPGLYLQQRNPAYFPAETT